MTQFFIALFVFLVIPNVLCKVFRVKKILPLVFLQLFFGVLINATGFAEQLNAFHINLLQGQLASALEGLGWLGVALLVAITGDEVAPQSASEQSARWLVGTISVMGFASTFLLGSTIGYGLALYHPELMGPLGMPWVFASGVGIALAVTALPVLLVIVRQADLAEHPIAKLATNCAMLDDLWLWLGMTAVLACATSTAASLVWLVVGLVAYLGLMFWLVRPALQKWYGRASEHGQLDGLMVAIAVILMSAALTGMIGLHSIFGSFVAGVVLPREALRRWRETMQQLIHITLLPAFFILTGMHLNLDVRSSAFWEVTAIVTVGAVLGKMASVAVCARCLGLSWKKGFALGSLMQCKGLMELIAINILLDAGIISRNLFSELAMMAMISTFVTLPMMRLFIRLDATGFFLINYQKSKISYLMSRSDCQPILALLNKCSQRQFRR